MSNEKNDIFEFFGNKNINAKLKYDNISDNDIDIIENELITKDYWKNFQMKEYYYKSKNLIDNILKCTNRIKNLDIQRSREPVFTSNLGITQKFSYKKLFMSPMEYYYLIKPNYIQAQVNISPFRINSNKNNKILFNDNISSLGVSYCQRKNKKNFFFENHSFFKNNFQLILKYIGNKSENDFKRKSKIFSSKASFIYDLNRKYSFIFNNFLPLHPINRIGIQFTHKEYNNIFEEVNVNQRPNEIISNLPEQDSQFNSKLFYEYNYLGFNFDNIKFNSSISFVKTLNNSFIKSKVFFRRLFTINNLISMQFNYESSGIFNISNDYDLNSLKVHEKLYIYNFKGILNPSKKCTIIIDNDLNNNINPNNNINNNSNNNLNNNNLDNSNIEIINNENNNNNKNTKNSINNNQGKNSHSYMLGNYFYSLFSNKIFFKQLPIFNNFNLNKDGFEISPFIHFSSLFTNYKFDYKKLIQNFKNGSIRLSSGFGISVLSKLYSFEVVYTPFIKKEISDIHSKFSVKFGID